MKRAYAILLALLLMLSGCSGNAKTNDFSANDVCCPYEINHKKDAVEITLRDGDESGILWDVEALPEGICQITQEDGGKESVSRFRLSGGQEGAAQLTFSAAQPDGAVTFVLTLLVDIDAKGNVVVSSYRHQELKDTSVEADGLNYKWNLDQDGVLNFSFIDSEDTWSARADETDVCVFTSIMSTPSGCKFSACANRAGQTTVVLTGDETQRKVHVVIRVDEAGKIEVLSVQEQ